MCGALDILPIMLTCRLALMEDGLIQVREVVGSEEQSGLADNKIKDALWEFYFDIDKTIRWCMGESHLLPFQTPSHPPQRSRTA